MQKSLRIVFSLVILGNCFHVVGSEPVLLIPSVRIVEEQPEVHSQQPEEEVLLSDKSFKTMELRLDEIPDKDNELRDSAVRARGIVQKLGEIKERQNLREAAVTCLCCPCAFACCLVSCLVGSSKSFTLKCGKDFTCFQIGCCLKKQEDSQ